jgi:uncharacterized protein YjbI with pentapeptide repeats
MQITTQNNQVIYDIKDTYGNVLFSYENEFLDLSDLDLTGANLSGVVAEGLICMDAKFVNANLEKADLYMMMACYSDFTNANLARSDLRGANCKGVIFQGALLRNANLGKDNMSGTVRLQGANLANAVLDGVRWQETEYDESTIFPNGFNPKDYGMRFVRTPG